jgi:hypothetical protein
MKVVGILTSAAVAAVAAGLSVVLVRSVPDIKRYLKIRQM